MTEELTLLSSQHPGNIRIDNLEQLKQALIETLKRYDGIIYTESMLSDAKADKRELTRLRREIDERRKDVKRAYLAPYNDFELQVKQLLAMIDAPLDEIKKFLAEMDDRKKESKRVVIREYFMKRCGALGNLATQVFESPAFFDDKWLNKTTSVKAWQDAVDAKIADAVRSISSIQSVGGAHTGALTAKYLETLSIEGLQDYRVSLEKVENADTLVPGTAKLSFENQCVGYKVLKLTGTAEQMNRVTELLALMDIDVEELDDGMPQPMEELTTPDFDSFVAFDIETTGTFGASNGDAPAEITEIGAVKVVNGRITERFSELINPGRKIVPRISQITHITDDMVADKPDISIILRKFSEFASNSILVGHNIKSSDLYYINRDAQKYGIRLENTFFDTYRYARTLKDSQKWEKVNLPYLAEKFGIEQIDAHRAWCDAEANAAVYFALQRIK